MVEKDQTNMEGLLKDQSNILEDNVETKIVGKEQSPKSQTSKHSDGIETAIRQVDSSLPIVGAN